MKKDGTLENMDWGKIVWMTPSQIMAEMGKECTPEIRERLEKMAKRRRGANAPPVD